MNQKNTLTLQWLISYMRDGIGYSAAHFVFGVILALIPLAVVYHFFESTTGSWVVISVVMAMFGGFTHNHLSRKRSELEKRTSEDRLHLNWRIQRLEYELSEKEKEILKLQN